MSVIGKELRESIKKELLEYYEWLDRDNPQREENCDKLINWMFIQFGKWLESPCELHPIRNLTKAECPQCRWLLKNDLT